MLFNSLTFLVFFPVVTIGYYTLPHRLRWFFLLIVSCLFYMYFIPVYILILFITIAIDYAAGLYIERSSGRAKRRYLIISILSTCLVLFAFKYYNFFIDNVNTLALVIGWNYSLTALQIILPIGLSFHTFQSLSYVIEVYRGHQKAEANFGVYSLYVMYYPQLVAGPIERPQNLLHQFKRVHHFRFVNFYRGLRLMVYGFFMKLVVADRLAVYVDAVYNNSEKHNGVTLALATIFFAFQIYCDFAGYSSIAIGASRMMGISLMTNFRRPYLAASVSAFWRRWHISLSTWFKDYLFISLGGSRVESKVKLYFNLILTFVISGFWHGANWTFVIWGALNGLYLIVEQATGLNQIRRTSYLRSMVVFSLIGVSWIFFRSVSVDQSLSIIKSILIFEGPLFVPPDPEMLVYCIVSVSMIVLLEIMYEKVYKNRRILFSRSGASNLLLLFCFLMILLVGVFDGGQFIYFQF